MTAQWTKEDELKERKRIYDMIIEFFHLNNITVPRALAVMSNLHAQLFFQNGLTVEQYAEDKMQEIELWSALWPESGVEFVKYNIPERNDEEVIVETADKSV